jgi:ribosomal protein L30/L7E
MPATATRSRSHLSDTFVDERPSFRVARKPKKKRGKHKRTPPRQFQRKVGKGDWLVKQVVSRIGTTPEQHETLVDLGLGKIGRSAIFDGGDKAAWGQIGAVEHLVAARPLTRPLERHDLYRKPEMTQPEAISYEVGGREARHYDFDGDSFLSIEPYGGSFAVNWSTALPIATVLERMPAGLLDRMSSCVVFDPTGPGQRQLDFDDALEELRGGRSEFPFVRLESDDFVFAWQRPAYPKHVDEDVGAGRIGLICQTFDAQALSQAIRATATPPLGECIKELIDEIAAVSGAEAA